MKNQQSKFLVSNRAQVRAELDATYARLYGLTRDELRYILDPKEVHGEDFPGETFRVLKEKEMRLYGEFRTRRLWCWRRGMRWRVFQCQVFRCQVGRY